MKVGDLVRIAKWCKNKHRMAIITEVFWFDNTAVKIQYLDECGLLEPPGRALKTNLVYVEEEK